MAVDFKDVDLVRGTVYHLRTQDLIIKPELNGRHVLPNITWLKESIREQGQTVPVGIRREAGRPVLSWGLSRFRAICEVNESLPEDKQLRISCVYAPGNELDGFLGNLLENRFRNDVLPIDDAYNIKRLVSYGWDIPKIAAFYKDTEKWVRDRLALVELCPEAQAALTGGTLKPRAAIEIAKLAADQQRKRLEKGGKITAAGLKAEATGKARKPTAAKIIKILRAVIDEGTYPDGFEFVHSKDPINDSIAAFCEAVLSSLGVRSDAK